MTYVECLYIYLFANMMRCICCYENKAEALARGFLYKIYKIIYICLALFVQYIKHIK